MSTTSVTQVRAESLREAGARWLRCDLHVHTPFDGEKKFGVDVRAAIEALKKADTTRLAKIAERFIEACRSAAEGAGIDVLALTDHNSIEGYRRLRPFFDSIAQRAAEERRPMPSILPGIELSVGGERPLHFLIIFASDTKPDDIDRLIQCVFGPREMFDPKTGTPRATGESISKFLEDVYKFCRPATGERDIHFVLLPAHADGDRGVGRETGTNDLSVATGLWDQMRGHLRESAVSRKDWNGFETSRSFERLPQPFRDLLLRWWAARHGDDWDQLSELQKNRYREQRDWPLIEASDPHRFEVIGSRYTWLKMEVPDVEGIRLALLDPQSRLRRMADGPPARNYPRIERLHVRRTDFFEDIEVPFSACLTTLIGGRGSGKSTIIEYLRHVLDRGHREDLPDDDPSNVREVVQAVLSPKKERDFGQTKGTLLPNYEILADLNVAGRRYRVRRSAGAIEVMPDPDRLDAAPANLDVRSLLVPRILSQRQIARIARDPASQRGELDALIDADRLREIDAQRRSLIESLIQLQAVRSRLTDQGSKLPAIETELRKVQDQIEFLEGSGRREVMTRFDAFERERRWIDELHKETHELAVQLEDQATALDVKDGDTIGHPSGTSAEEWLRSVAERARMNRHAVAMVLRHQAKLLRDFRDTLEIEKKEQWLPSYEEVRSNYAALRQELAARGVDFAQHERLLQRRAQVEREQSSLLKTGQELEDVARKLKETRLQLIAAHEARLGARRLRALALEEADADVRVEVFAFRDREDFASRRETWFGGAGLQERDWDVICDYVFAPDGDIPDRIRALVDAMRSDALATAARGAPLDGRTSQVSALLGSNSLTKNFFHALTRRDRIRFDEMERFLPEDLVLAKVRAPDGSFKSIETGSVGERSTAILSLLLSSGDQPIIFDQPEDDLDNQYIYNVVVELLRRRKFSRQVIIATHNANIPVNGDAELICALGVKERLGMVLGAGSIDRAEIKQSVSLIMEGSAEAFRLRGERYGY